MDAREYLARKGLDGERDQERPNTLEEKAWSRAREAGDHRPHSGTPHDWEDWERHHAELAESAKSIEQKIDLEAHRHGLDHQQRDDRGPKGDAELVMPDRSVETFDPGHVVHEEDHTVGEAPEALVGSLPKRPRLALLVLAVLLPPLALGLAGLRGKTLVLNVFLTLLGWLPGACHALWWLKQRTS
ncbi:YqaE/Pmp3 family membrane protein [Halomonas urumqiensis]|uniref:YqaE/Pmp3 family membrane protein n=1 Tax=Halomonas urumqiensis TaxID=1684789 RepID=A0A2N7UKT0_9GAMM|nr:YqaE/Pmp3 family membrane protein [Halomonas urumqiensis]PMR81034.1 YqaE/Pmp3 family membrane protein [Halomonas urumqiensis]PTB01109.1 YqaE/Pmp3 family membrane protein [Halomonas urumqiensis]GHE22837.1 hypothetical protein GCM10017767_33580 [Halomonas urumqiensis]